MVHVMVISILIRITSLIIISLTFVFLFLFIVIVKCMILLHNQTAAIYASVCFCTSSFRARTNGSPKARILRVGFSIPICNPQWHLARSICCMGLVLFHTVKLFNFTPCCFLFKTLSDILYKFILSESQSQQFTIPTLMNL